MGNEIRFLTEVLLADMAGIDLSQVNRIHVNLQSFLTAVGIATLLTNHPFLCNGIFLLSLLGLNVQPLQLAILNFPLMSFKITVTSEAFLAPKTWMFSLFLGRLAVLDWFLMLLEMIVTAGVFTNPEHQGVNICYFLKKIKESDSFTMHAALWLAIQTNM